MEHLADVRTIMTAFAERTGLSSPDSPPRRYLWTDAFAVCNFLELFRTSGREDDRRCALRLIEQVHHVLGRHRPDESRRGWISGLSAAEGERHPTAGGLRIGKIRPERRPNEPFDERLEWDRDGQYLHYLTRWMQALNRAGIYTGDPRLNEWAIELARVAHARFAWRPRSDRPPRMYWKMSIDLSRPLVSSMGHHDPLDACVTYSRLQASSRESKSIGHEANLGQEIAECAAMCEGGRWATDDPLGAGGLLASGCELAWLSLDEPRHVHLLETVLQDALESIPWCVQSNFLERPAEYRLAFRELGLSIGLHGVRRMIDLWGRSPRSQSAPRVSRLLHDLQQYLPLCAAIERFWLYPAHQLSASWLEHEDINSVMLATSLAPHVYLTPVPTEQVASVS
jgi:hypothetical protein